MQQQGSKLAPAVTPRPIKAGQASPKPPPTAARGGRTYALGMSPAKRVHNGGDGGCFAGLSPFQPQQKSEDPRPPEFAARSSPSPSPSPPALWRKKPLILSGDVRNLGGNFLLAPPPSTHARGVSLAHVAAVFSGYGVPVSPDEAQALLHEYEENNDGGVGYAAFVADVVESCRRSGNAVVGRGQIRKARLAEHLGKLGARHAVLMDELHDALARHLRVSWAAVRDALRQADASRSGFLSTRDFARVLERDLRVPVSAQVLNMLATPPASASVGAADSDLVDYSAFLLQFGSDFQHGDTKTVSESLVFERLGKVSTIGGGDSGSVSPVSNTLRSPGVSSALDGYATAESAGASSPTSLSAAAAPSPPKKRVTATTYSAMTADPLELEQLRVLLNDKISSRYSDVKKAFMALDRDGNGAISAAEFTRVLRNFNLELPPRALHGLMAHFDANGDGVVDYREFFAVFGDVIKPSAGSELEPDGSATTTAAATATTTAAAAGTVTTTTTTTTAAAAGPLAFSRRLYENSSLVFSGQRDVQGANKNRSALSSPGNELKEAFACLPDDSWRSILVALESSDPARSGLVPAAELLRVLSMHMGDLPARHFGALFRACGSHTHNLMAYRALVRSYRAVVLDPVAFHKQDAHARAEMAFRKSPTESLVMVWSVRVQRAQLSGDQWAAVKDALYAQDTRRAGRLPASAFARVVQPRLALSDAQVAFLCVFYEDKLLAQSLAGGNADGVHIRYASFLTDYEDPGLEAAASSSSNSNATDGAGSPRRRRGEGKARVRPPYMQSMQPNGLGPGREGEEDEAQAEERRLREFCRANVRALEGRLRGADADGRGFVSLDAFRDVWRQLSHGRGPKSPSRQEARAQEAFFAKYVSQSLFYYRGLLLDCDAAAGLQTHALVLQDDDDDDDDDTGDADGGDAFEDEPSAPVLDAYEAREAVRHLLTASRGKQRAVYKLFQAVDPTRSGQLTAPEVRRVLERLGVALSDEGARDLLGAYEAAYEAEDEAGERVAGRVQYLQLLHALGGRDPDKLDGLSDVSSNCSYYSAVGISPRAVRKPGQLAADARAASRDSHVLAASAVANAIERPNGRGDASGAAAVERSVQNQLQQLGKAKWKQVAKSLRQADGERRGSVSPQALRKVLAEAGVRLGDDELMRLARKYDVEQDGRFSYPAFLRTLTSSLSDLPEAPSGFQGLPALHSGGGSNNGATPRPSGGVPESLRAGIKAKWKPIYASLKTLDKGGAGRVTAAQFRQLLEWYALPVPDDLLLLVLRQFDREDGLVDYNAFMRACIA